MAENEKVNPIIEFLNDGGDLLSNEGIEIIMESSRDDLQETLKNKGAGASLIQAMSKSTIPKFKQKILDACQ